MVKYLLYWILIFINIIIISRHSYANDFDDQELIVSLKVNHEDLDSLSTIIQTQSGNLLIPLEDINQFNVKEEYLSAGITEFHDKKYVNLNKLEQTKIKYDSENLALEIIFPVEKMKIQKFNAIPSIDNTNLKGLTTSGMFMNYDLTFTHSSNTKYMSGLQDLNYFSEYGILYNSFFYRSNIPNKGVFKEKKSKKIEKDLLRLESNWTFDNVNDIARWRVGDSITKGADWSGGTRFAGIQYSTNFATRPDLITHPLLNFTGRSELPSTIDVFINANSIYQGNSKTGDFEIDSLPIPTGRGELIIKAQDITGKVKTFILPYYISPTLLAKGLSDFSFEVGTQRKEFGLNSNKYKYLISNSNYIWGVSDTWTSSLHLESLKDLASTGTTNSFQIGHLGLVTLSLASNIHKLNKSQKMMAGYSYQIGSFSYSLNISKSAKKYQDIYNYPTSTPTGTNLQASVGYNNKKFGNLFLSLLSYQPGNSVNKSDKIEMIMASYDKQLTENSTIRFTTGTDLKSKKKAAFAYLSFNANFGNKSIGVSNSIQKGRAKQQLNVSSQSNTPMGWGYRANIGKGERYDYNVQVNKNTEFTEGALYLFDSGNNRTEQLGLTGSVVMMDKGLYLARPIYNSLALVKVGKLKNIPVYNNNLKVGYTNGEGKVLIPNVISYSPSEIKLDQRKLPLDTNFASTTLTTAPKWKTGVILDFEVTRVKSIEMVLVDQAHKVIPFDEQVIIEDIKDELFVGYDGKLYINDIGDLRDLKGKICDKDECCHFEIPVDQNSKDPIIDLGEVVCH